MSKASGKTSFSNRYERAFLSLLLRLSYRALATYPHCNFIQWSEVNRDYNSILIRLILRYYKILSKKKISSHFGVNLHNFLFNAVSDILDIHFQQRASIKKNLEKLGIYSKKLFVLVAKIAIFYGLMRLCLYSISSLFLKPFYVSCTKDIKNVSLAINFPQHSYSILSSQYVEGTLGYSSFGEFLQSYVQKNNISGILTIGESIRKSKKLELESKITEHYPESINRIRATTFFSLSNFIACFKFIFFESRILHKKIGYWDICLNVYLYSEECKLKKFRNLISMLGARGVNVHSIFIPMYDKSIKYGKYLKLNPLPVIECAYSENVIIPPSIFGGSPVDASSRVNLILKNMSFKALVLSGKSIGFTRAYKNSEIAWSIFSKHFNLPGVEKNMGIQEEINKSLPMSLGFEILENTPQFLDQRLRIGLFDVPPEDPDFQLKRALLGDMSANFEFIESFLSEACQAIYHVGGQIILKPKYSINNYSYEYGALIKDLQRKYGDSLIISSPYNAIKNVMQQIDYSINFPYTSTALVGAAFGVQSWYYVPRQFSNGFSKGAADNVVLGYENLLDRLKLLQSN